MSKPETKNSLVPRSEFSNPRRGNSNEVPTIKKYIVTNCSGELCNLGNLRLKALRTALVGTDFKLFPVVNAATEIPPKKPPSVAYKDLPIYESPHYEYKEYFADRQKCPNHKVRLMHDYLYPSVRKFRKEWSESIGGIWSELKVMKSEVCEEVCKKRQEFIKEMRSSDNLNMRQGIVVTGAVTGYCLAAKRGVPSKIFYTTMGGLAGGALCFPEETDGFFRNLSYTLCKLFLCAYNKTCGKGVALREQVPCADAIGPMEAQTQKPCPKKSK